MAKWIVQRSSAEYFNVYNEKGLAVGCFKAENENQTMFRYGKSKVMHWNTLCATPNTCEEPQEITMREGYENGIKPCKNCWGRTRNIQGRVN